MPLSIFDTHTQILGVIPASKKLLIDELCRFVKTVQPRHADKKIHIFRLFAHPVELYTASASRK